MYFPPLTPLTPPKLSNQALNFLTKTKREFKATHRVGWNCLHHQIGRAHV